jgi:hypothetical protein
MSGESPKKIGRGYERNLDAGQFEPMIDSWDLHLRPRRNRPRRSAPTLRQRSGSLLST